MPLIKHRSDPEKHAAQAAQEFRTAASHLASRRTGLSHIQRAAASLAQATKHLDAATAHPKQDPSTTIILRSAATTAATALDHLEKVHQRLEDAYVAESSPISPTTIQTTLDDAATAARKDTLTALNLMQDTAGTTIEPPFIPPALTQALRNRAVIAITATALAISTGLAIHDTPTFIYLALATALASQQGIMIWALIYSIREDASPKRTDFYATAATVLTAILGGLLILTDLPPQGAIQITGITFALVLVEWAAARAMAAHQDHPQDPKY